MKRITFVAAAGLILAGCGGSHASSIGPTPHSQLPVRGFVPVVVAAYRMSPDMLQGWPAQLLSPRRLEILTTGSSSCPAVPDDLIVENRHTIRINLTVGSWTHAGVVARRPAGGVCTADYGTTRIVVGIPQKLIEVHHPLTIRVYYPESKKPRIWKAAPLR